KARPKEDMRTLISTSTLVCNVFDYWRRIRSIGQIAKACGVPSTGFVTDAALKFNEAFPITDGDRTLFGKAHPLDVVIRYEPPNVRAAAIAATHQEAYASHRRLPQEFLDKPEVWTGLKHSFALAGELSPKDKVFRYLDGPGLLRHVLGLQSGFGHDGFLLVY